MKRMYRILALLFLAQALLGASAWAASETAEIEATNVVVMTNAAVVVAPAEDPAPESWQTFGLDRLPWFRVKVAGNPVWQYIASLIYIILAFYISRLIDWIIQTQLRKWAARTTTKLDDLLLDLVRGPVRLISFVILVHVGLRVFSWPAWATGFISNALKIGVAISLTYVAIKIVNLLMTLWQQRVQATNAWMLDMGLLPVIRKTAIIFVIVVAALVTLQNLGMNVTSILASLSIGGLAVGLAAQDTLSNLFGAVALFGDKPFRVGDAIQLDTITGKVESIGLRSTRVRNLDGFLVTVPNRTMANANIVNISLRPNIKTILNIGVTYDTPSNRIQRAMQIIEEIYRPHPLTADLQVSFNRFDASALNIQVIHWWNSTDWNGYVKDFQKLNLELKRRFDEEQINFAFPTQTIYLKQDSEWRLASIPAHEPGH